MDPGDLAAWAEATGKPMAPVGNPRHEGRQAVAAIGTVPEVATPATPAEDRQKPATLGNEGRQGSAAIGTVPILATPAEVDALRGTVRALEVERDFLRRVLDNVTKALPAGQPEADRWKVYAQELEQWQALGWWARRKHRRPEPPDRGGPHG